jgi:outer membrane protein assembly factor BamD
MTLEVSRQIGFGVAVLALALLAAACGGDRTRPPEGVGAADKFLFERGTEALGNRRWLAAREYFTRLVDGYPQSPHRADAKLGLGDTYLGENTAESLVLAVNEFREFLTFYPTHERADYAQYKIGMAHYQQMRGPERDQTETKEAVKEFEEFVTRYPNSALMPEVQAKLREARDRLSQSEFRVGLFYYRSRWYPGAIDRFKTVLTTDPQYTGRDAVYYYLAESLLKTNRKAEALPYYERLLDEFQVSEYLDEARERVAELKVDQTATGR